MFNNEVTNPIGCGAGSTHTLVGGGNYNGGFTGA